MTGRERAVILVCLAAVTLLAWAYLVHVSQTMTMASMDRAEMADMPGMVMTGAMTARWTATDVLLTFAMWTAMMVGMMTPSAAPIVMLASRALGSATAGIGRAPVTALAFAGGYFAVWTGFSLIAALVQWLLHETAVLSPAMAASSPIAAGAILVGAGLYQFVPAKDRCLTHCRSPIDFLIAHWRPGLGGAFRVGLHHGAYCLGCCWALMLVLFAVGAMNLLWVAVLAVLVLLEKTLPRARLVTRIAGVGLVVLGFVKILNGIG